MVICDDYTRTNRPLGALYDDRNRGRGVAELTEITVNSVSATSATITNLTVSNILPIAGTVYVSGALQADSFIGLGGTGANSFPELTDVSPSYTPTPGNIIIIDSGGDLNSSAPSSFLDFVENGGLAEDINPLTPTGGIDQYLWFNNTNPVLGTLGSTGNALLGAINAGDARTTLGLGGLALANSLAFEDLTNTFDPTDGSTGDVVIIVGGGLSFAPSTTFTGGGGATTLDDLTDVIITTPVTNNLLRYNGTKWVNIATSSLTHSSLGSLSSDDHTQYSLVDGSRSYTGNISTTATVPTVDSHLTRKDYVDAQINFATSYADDLANLTLIPLINARQVSSTLLNNLSAVTPTANTLIYFSGTNLPALTTITGQARSLLDDSTAAENRGTIGLSGATNTFLYYSGTNLPAFGPITAQGREIINLSMTGGDIIYYDGATVALLGIGSEQSLLRVRSGGTAPQWLDPGAEGDVLTITGGELTWAAPTGGSTNLNGLTDVTISTPNLNSVLTYNGSEWVNTSPSTTRGFLGLSATTDKMLYFSGTNLVATNDITTVGRSVLSATTASQARLNLGLGNLAVLDTANFSDLADAFDPADANEGDVLIVNAGTNTITYVPSTTFAGGGGSPGGETGSIQYYDGGSFGGEPDFKYNSTTNVMSVPTASATTVSAGTLHLGGSDGNLINNNGKILVNASQGVSCTGGFSSTTLTVGSITQSSKEAWTYLYLTADVSTTATANATITELRIPVVDNSFIEFEGKLFIRTASATVGPRPGIAFPTGATQVATRIESPNSNTAAALRFQGAISTQNTGSTGLPTTTDTYLSILEGLVRLGSGTSGGITPTIASEAANNNVAVLVGSFVRYRTYTV